MHFELQPHLIGDLVELRPLCDDEFDVLYAVASDPGIWEVHPEPDRHKEEVFRKFFITAIESGGAFLVIDRKTGDVIGSSRYSHLDPGRSEVEIGWTFLARAYWGGRYNREMKRLMLSHAFKFVDRVVLLVGPQNFRSRRAVEKIGGTYIGRRIADGRESVVYEITAEQFASGPLMKAREEQIQRAVRE
jgi:RimJ/RimL family protein N-acetyltransferase